MKTKVKELSGIKWRRAYKSKLLRNPWTEQSCDHYLLTSPSFVQIALDTLSTCRFMDFLYKAVQGNSRFDLIFDHLGTNSSKPFVVTGRLPVALYFVADIDPALVCYPREVFPLE